MRDCLFLVADKNMKYALRGVFARDQVHRSLGTSPFRFDLEQDVHIALRQADSGIYKRAIELLKKLKGSCRHAIIMVDAEWGGSPGAAAIRQRLAEHFERAGWDADHRLGLVIEPEVDVWLWTDSPPSVEECNEDTSLLSGYICNWRVHGRRISRALQPPHARDHIRQMQGSCEQCCA